MNNFHLFDMFPIGITYLGIVTLILISAWLGIRFAKWRMRHIKNEEDAPISTIVGATLALLAFILAFTFGLTSSRFDMRKQLLLEEVNTIETTYLRASLIPDPYQTEVKELIKEYVDIRVEISKNIEEVHKYIIKSELIQKRIWVLVTEMVHKEEGNTKINNLFIISVNQLFSYHTKRKEVGIYYRIPMMFWMALFTLIILAMFEVGYLIGKMKKPNLYLILALSLAFSAIVILIVDLDSTRGSIQVNHHSMIELQERLSADY